MPNSKPAPPAKTGACDRCQVLRIQGVRCHEAGCPAAFRDEQRECDWCGAEFQPESARQKCCSEDCWESNGG